MSLQKNQFGETDLHGAGTAPVKVRDSNIEFFRILTMLLIVAHHYVVQSGLDSFESGPIFQDPMSFRSMFLLLFGAWGKTGINCFVMISCYFMCKSKITASKFMKLLLEIKLYKILGFVIFLLLGYETWSLSRVFNLILPLGGMNRGFADCFLAFYLCIPFLNILTRHMTEKQHICLTALLLLIYSVLPTIPVVTVTMNYLTWFCVLYFVASYIRLYPKALWDNTKFWGWTAAGTLILASLSIVVCNFISARTGLGGSGTYWFVSDSNKVMAVAVAVSGFLFFKNLKMKPSRFINTVASTTFGVLLIHCCSNGMKEWLWTDLLHNVDMYASPFMLLHAVGAVVGIFAVCSALDYLRIRFLEKPFFRCYWPPVERAISGFVNRLFGKIVPESKE